MKKISGNKTCRVILSAILLLAMIINSAFAAVVAVGDSTLNELINAAATGDTIVLDKDYTETVTVPADKKVTIDLNGHNVTSTANTVITVNGDLTLTDSVGTGSVNRTVATGDLNVIVVNSGATFAMTSGTVNAVTSTSGVATAIKNMGTITVISGGDILASTPGSNYAYGLWNTGGTVSLISGGYFYGAITAFNKNGNNAMAVNNSSGTISSITGGIFYGNVRTSGGGYGIRNDANVTVSGGVFKGNTAGNAVYARGGSFVYANGTSLESNDDGPKAVLAAGEHAINLVNENEDPIATYIYNADGKLTKTFGHKQASYSVYVAGVAQTMAERDLSQYKVNTTLTVCTETDKPVYYFLGSSVTYGSNNYGNSYADFLEDDYSYVTNKRAVSGTTLIDNGSGSYVQRMLKQISKNTKMDHLVIQLSTNDASQNKPFGVLSDSYDMNDFDTSTVIGAIEYIIAYAYDTWGCDVTFWTNPKYESDNYYGMYEYLFDIQDKWDIGVLDYYILGTPKSEYMDNDIHPNEAGYRWMTPIADDFFKNYKNGEENVDTAKVNNVIGLIDAIGTVTAEKSSIEKIQAARTAFAALSPAEKNAVTNADTMRNAFANFNRLYTEANNGKVFEMNFESSSLNDTAGRTTAVADTCVTFVNGKEANTTAAHFDKSQNKKGVTFNSKSFDPLSGIGTKASISAWVYLDSAPSNNSTVFMEKALSGDSTFGFMQLKANSTSWQMSLRGIGGAQIDLTSTIAPAAGKWTLITYVQDGDIGKLYINNILAVTSAAPTIASTFTTAGGVEFFHMFSIGCSFDSSQPSLPGAVDSFAVYSKALTTDEISDLYDPSYKETVAEINRVADENGGKLVSLDFEDGTANDVAGRITPIVGSSVTFADEGKYGSKSASFTSTKSTASMIRWKQDEYDPLLYAQDGTTVSMWVNFSALSNNEVIFNYGFWGYRFILARNGGKLLVSARNYDSTTSEFNIEGLDNYVGKGWTLLTLTCDSDKNYTVYFNGVKTGSQQLKYSLYDIAANGSLTAKRNTTDAANNYYGYYSIGGASYWADRVNMVAMVDDFAIYNKVLSTKEIMDMYDPNQPIDAAKVNNVISLINKLSAYSATFMDDKAAAKAAYDELSDYEKANVTNIDLLTNADSTYYNSMADLNGGKYASIDFEDGTANDSANRFTPIVGDSVSIVDNANYGSKSASFTSTKTTASMLRWKQDEYDPLLYSENGATVSMWVNFSALSSNEVIFNYGFWGYRFILARNGGSLLVSARNYDSTSSEFNIPGIDNYVGAGWTLLTVSCDENKVYTVYLNGEQVGRQILSFSLYDLAYNGATTTKRNTTDETNQYYGYYSIGGASYWADRVNMVALVDDFAIYNSALSAEDVSAMYNIDDPAMLAKSATNAIKLIRTVDFSFACGTRIKYARSIYDSLTDEAKALVLNYSDLTVAEEAYADLYKGLRKVDNATQVTVFSGPSNSNANENYDKLFDGLDTTKFGNGSYTTPFIWKVDEAVTAKYYSLTTGTDSGTWTGRNPTTWNFYGSNDYNPATGRGTWSDVAIVADNTSLPDANSVEVMFSIDTPAEYQYYKIEFPSQGDKYMQLSELSLYAYAYADYTAVDAALARVPDDLSIYTAASAAKLTAAINAVVRDLYYEDQTTVNAYALAIDNAVDTLAIKSADMSIDISEGMIDNGEREGLYNITWNATIKTGEGVTIEDVNTSGVVFKEYGVYYATGKEVLADYKNASASEIRNKVFANGTDIDVYTSFGYRLKGVHEDSVRAAMFYIEYEYNGNSYIVLSTVDEVIATIAE